MISLNAYFRDQQGGSAAEFALVIPMFLALVLGVMHLSFVVYSAVTLHQATEATARCLSVSANNTGGATASTSCPGTPPTAAQVQAYGQSRYVGPRISPTFSLGASAACTNEQQLTGSGTYNMGFGFVNIPITVTAKACFPHA